MTFDGFNTYLGAVGLHLVQLTGSAIGVDLTINHCILTIGLSQFLVVVDSLVVILCSSTTVVTQCSNVA